ncbi:MAG: cyclic nucleotide-binding domain-containing protein, partial [Bdellovibrionota bacterium]
GIVGVYKNNQLTGTMYDIGQLRAGSAFGEMSLIDNNPRSATVRALTDCHMFFLSREAFQKFLSTSIDLKLRFYESCIRTIVQRVRQLDESYVISQYQLWKTALKKEAA